MEGPSLTIEDSLETDNACVIEGSRHLHVLKHDRREAAAALAGDDYRVVPAEEYDTDFDGWKEVSRREAIRQADHFHAELIQTLGANDEIRREVDDLRKQLHEAEAQVAQPDRPEPVDPASGAGLIAAERARQVSEEGRSTAHDDRHRLGELEDAAKAYLLDDGSFWPWEESTWKPTPADPVRQLVKAGALIAAEIDRLQRPEPEPNEAAVEALTWALYVADSGDGDRLAPTWDEITPSERDDYHDIARTLIRDHGVHVEVSTDDD